jgi:hypothetical protein
VELELAAKTIAAQLLGHDPDPATVAWVMRMIRTCLPRDEDATPVRRVTWRRFPPQD